MQIDVRSPEGNTLVALSYAIQMLKKVGRNDDAKKLSKDVWNAGSAKEARNLITEATNGSITFIGDVNSGE